MKKITRFLCVAVSVFILFTALPYSVSAKLSDISGTTNEKIITRWHEAGLISGYPDGTFKSEVYITRAQFAKIISDLFVLDGETVKYEDVSENDWYYPYVNRVSEYMTCYKSDASENCNELFMPDEKMDMTQAVEILSKLTKVPDEIKQNVKGFATREDLVVLLDNLLGGEPGFSYMLIKLKMMKFYRLPSLQKNLNQQHGMKKGRCCFFRGTHIPIAMFRENSLLASMEKCGLLPTRKYFLGMTKTVKV